MKKINAEKNMTQINAYVSFNGKCREAMNFYKECIGGELQFQTFDESPIAEHLPADKKDYIIHSSLTDGERMLMASDMTGPDGYNKGNNVTLSLSCRSEEEINKLYEKLSKGGEVLEPLRKQFFGGTMAAFYDKFGIRWMVVYMAEQN